MRRGGKVFVLLVLAAVLGWGSGEVLVRAWRAHARSGPAEVVAPAAVERELDLLRGAFGGEEGLAAARRASHLSPEALEREIADNLSARASIEEKIAPRLLVDETELRAAYETQRERFQRPAEYRVAHLFLAAPTGTKPEVVTAQLNKILGLSVRRLAGEDWSKLIAENSEDPASKARAGDLGWLSDERLPPEFFAEIVKLRPGEFSSPFRSPLGFHIVQLAEVRPAREVDFAEARPELAAELANAKRAAAVAELAARGPERK